MNRMSLRIKHELISTLKINMPWTIAAKNQIRIHERLGEEVALLIVLLIVLTALGIHIRQNVKALRETRICVDGLKSIPSPVLILGVPCDAPGVVVRFHDFRAQVVGWVRDPQAVGLEELGRVLIRGIFGAVYRCS